ncbi:hypothetical protein FQA39_LY13003 [Lamprigera yunnana]|nr:hypothetical protein FQA39_LY13003 [Lamprigera yunnana]
MPHLLVAGSTGSGKSVMINALICSILLRAKPTEVKFLMIDPKKVELSVYSKVPHMLTPVISDMSHAAKALQMIVLEMERRYELFSDRGAKNIEVYNKLVTGGKKLPFIVVIIDELADLMMTAGKKDVEESIMRITQMARAAGIHLIAATQRPSVDVITGTIKTNIPTRIAFAVTTGIDSRTILDSIGAENLLGSGDMLFAPPGSSDLIRAQDKPKYEDSYSKEQLNSPTSSGGAKDSLYDEVRSLVILEQRVSASLIQRKFNVGYNRALNIIDQLEAEGIIPDESIFSKGDSKYGEYMQSKKLDRYKELAYELIEKGFAYHCFCSVEELEKDYEEQTSRGIVATKYSQKCLRLTREEVNDNSWDVKFEGKDLGDFVILKANQVATYNFAVVVDDYDMEISHDKILLEFLNKIVNVEIIDVDTYLAIDDYMMFNIFKLCKTEDDSILADLSDRLVNRRLFKIRPEEDIDDEIEEEEEDDDDDSGLTFYDFDEEENERNNMKKVKYVFVTGGVVSGLGKGITGSSLGALLKNSGLKVYMQKFDPYLNVDPGTMSPYQHGEVFVTDDGGETDLDLGHYEPSAGKIYLDIIEGERRGDGMGQTIQVVPHVTNKIKQLIYAAGERSNADVVITEIGGTVGDIESQPFIEAIRQVRMEQGRENTLFLHVALLLYLSTSKEYKTKPIQNSVKELLSNGIQPDIIVTRSDKFVSPDIKEKISLFCNIKPENVIEAIDKESIYEVPLVMMEQNLHKIVINQLKLDAKKTDMSS